MTDDNRFSLAEVVKLRCQAFDKIREHSAAIDRLAAALADLDTALTSCIDEKNIDELQRLVDAARRLAAILDGEPK